MRFGHKAIHQRRLAHPGMAQQHCDFAGEQVRHSFQRIVTARDDHLEIQVGELLGERGGGREVGLGQAQDREQSAGVGRDQRPVDQPGAWRWIGQRHHDQQLIGVGDDHPLGGIGVIGGAPQHCSPRSTTDDAGQGIRPTGQITDHVDIVADDDRCAAQFASPHRRDPLIGGIAVEHTPPPAAVDADHHRRLRVGVLRAGFGPRPRTSSRADFDVGLVVVAGPQPLDSRSSMSAHIRGKFGSVLAVVSMSSTSTPATRSPTIAPAVAIR